MTQTMAAPLTAYVREVFLLAVADHYGLTPERHDGEWVLVRFVDPEHGDLIYRAVAESGTDSASTDDLHAHGAKSSLPITEAVCA